MKIKLLLTALIAVSMAATTFAAPLAPPLDDAAPVLGGHPLAKTVFSLPLHPGWLIGPFHRNILSAGKKTP